MDTGTSAGTGNEAATATSTTEQAAPKPASYPNTLQGRVGKALAEKNLTPAMGVHVKTFGPVVKLYGTVANGVISDKAKYVASQVAGVAEVSNDLKVRGE